VESLKKDIAPTLTVTRRQALSVNKTTRVVERMVESFRTYDSERKLGYLSRVLFFHKLEWALRDAGYAKEFVELIQESLLSGVGARSRPAKG
jgi:hypothetical protein